MPPALIESAKIDGAGELRTFFQIVLPLSLPVLASVGLLVTLNYWNDWFLSVLFIRETTGRRRFNSGCTARCSTSSISAPTPRHTRPSCKRIRTSRCRAKQREWRWASSGSGRLFSSIRSCSATSWQA
ncbi:ABC transporter permease subunit [Cohnella faecalis]|uniref:ABC transporter permease subunit n=1 Tax=Cohnella faecalis TaxID=2315694 RepID=UPI002D778800|nr:ABC transporter permease subunit [Cohnella faecalis]